MLQLRNSRINYAGVAAVKDLAIEVHEGEVVSVIGANGAGKTTTLRAIAGLVRVASGEIWFGDQRIDHQPPDRIVKLGVSFVPEGRRIFNHMTVLENLVQGAYARRDREIAKDLEKMYRRFPILEERKHQSGASLSGGQQQMLAIARGLMARPKLLLIDEPTLGLSPMLVTEIASIIGDISKEGTTVLLVEQNAEVAFALAHRIYVLEVGEVVARGTPRELTEYDDVRKAYLGA